jgi:hypothetical protein
MTSVKYFSSVGGCFLVALATAPPVMAAPFFFFSTGNPDDLIATASRPGTGTSVATREIESADDFALPGPTSTALTSATFTGLVPLGSSAGDVKNIVVEIYGVFPVASDVGRTSGSPLFSTSQVPTRVNSPSDVALDSRDSSGGSLSFTTTTLAGSLTAAKSVQPGGINPKPGQTTGGDGQVIGEEVQFNVSFTDPFTLAPGHYFFVPQVQLDNGDFLWLSAAKPIVSPGTPFPAGFNDLQSWTRDQPLDPDWLRVGTDIVGVANGAPLAGYNATFSLTGEVPEPGSFLVLGTGLVGMGLLRRRGRRAVRGTAPPTS